MHIADLGKKGLPLLDIAVNDYGHGRTVMNKENVTVFSSSLCL